MVGGLASLILFFQDEVAQGDLDGTKQLLGHSLVSGLARAEFLKVPKNFVPLFRSRRVVDLSVKREYLRQ